MRNSQLKVLSPSALLVAIVLCFALPVVIWLALGPRVPEGTFFLISRLENVTASSDPSNVIYSFARPPIYLLLGWVFSRPWAFLIAGYLSHAIFSLVVFFIAYKGASNSQIDEDSISPAIVAGLVTAIIYPVALVAGLAGSGTSLVPHDTYHQFSFRTIFSSVAGISFLFLLYRKPAPALLMGALGCYIHPTAGFLLLGLLTLATARALFMERQMSLLVAWVAAILVGAAPMLRNLLLFEMPASLSAGMGYGDWYSQMIKDEADDFSILYQLVVYPMHTTRLLLVIVLPAIVYMYLFPAYSRHRNFWYLMAIPCLFLAAGFLEFLFAVVLPTPLIYPLCALTPGYRILSFAFFPLVVIGSRILQFLALKSLRLSGPRLSPVSLRTAAVALVLISCVSLVAVGVTSGRTATSLRYAGWAWKAGEVPGVDTYLQAVHSSGGNRYYTPALKVLTGPVVTYPHERNIFRIRSMDRAQPHAEIDAKAMERLGVSEFVDLMKRIRAEIPLGSGLIIPPYLLHFRDALPGHPIFFQEHHDGNLMLGSPVFAKFWTDRMIDLLGFSYEGMPSKYSGLSIAFMRNAYLRLSNNDVQALHTKYPDYPYFVTESNHALDFHKLIETRGFVVYDLQRRRGP